MATSRTADLFGTAAAPTALTAAYQNGNTFRYGGDYNQCVLYVTIAGFDATSTEVNIQFSDDGGTTWFDQLTQETAGGIVTQLTAERRVPPANGTYAIELPLPSSQHMRVRAKRTNGTNATTMHISATFGWVG